jgi:hypothetical protein
VGGRRAWLLKQIPTISTHAGLLLFGPGPPMEVVLPCVPETGTWCLLGLGVESSCQIISQLTMLLEVRPTTPFSTHNRATTASVSSPSRVSKNVVRCEHDEDCLPVRRVPPRFPGSPAVDGLATPAVAAKSAGTAMAAIARSLKNRARVLETLCLALSRTEKERKSNDELQTF